MTKLLYWYVPGFTSQTIHDHFMYTNALKRTKNDVLEAKIIFLENNLIFVFSAPKNHTFDIHMSMDYIMMFSTSRGHPWRSFMEVKNIERFFV